jgi:hypothetical protein
MRHRPKIIDLSFAHRVELLNKGGRRYLVAANLTADKSDPSDRSRTGALHASPVPRQPGESWELVPILEGIHRNHGLIVRRYGGSRARNRDSLAQVRLLCRIPAVATPLQKGQWWLHSIHGEPTVLFYIEKVDVDQSGVTWIAYTRYMSGRPPLSTRLKEKDLTAIQNSRWTKQVIDQDLIAKLLMLWGNFGG